MVRVVNGPEDILCITRLVRSLLPQPLLRGFVNQISGSFGGNMVRRYYGKPAFYIFLPRFEVIVLVILRSHE